VPYVVSAVNTLDLRREVAKALASLRKIKGQTNRGVPATLKRLDALYGKKKTGKTE
jgi:hypothetical protein